MNSNNENSIETSRREFVKKLSTIGIAIGVVALTGCANESETDDTMSRGPAWSQHNLETYCEGYKEDKENDSLQNEYTAIKDGEVYRIYRHQGKYYAIFEGFESE